LVPWRDMDICVGVHIWIGCFLFGWIVIDWEKMFNFLYLLSFKKYPFYIVIYYYLIYE
jgi:hypothetical protein